MRKVTFIRWIGLSLLLVLAAIGFWSGSSGTVFAQSPDEASVTFPDPNLEAIIREAIGKPAASIYISDVETLTSLSAEQRSISNLTGLEYCIRLEELDLSRNSISDISMLAGLTHLEVLDLSWNRISDISPLAGLTHLEVLDLSWNRISDISPLAGLTNLEVLYLAGNSISDISPLARLTNLKVLDLSNNYSLNDISPLAGLTNLEVLNLYDNRFSDISPLARLTNLEVLDLGNNYPLSDISPLSGLTNLEVLNLHVNGISDISPLAGLTNLKELDLYHNMISDISPMLSDKWLSQDYHLVLDYNPLSTTSLHLGIPLLQKTGVDVSTPSTDPDWSFLAGAFIPLAGASLAPICYLATRRRRKWLRPATLVMGLAGAVLLALWLLPAATSYTSFETSSVPEGIAVFLAIVACLIILTSTAVGWRRELSGGILMIVGGLIAGVAYPFWLFHTASILTLFPLVSGFLYLLSWRDKPRRTTVEYIERGPGPAQSRKRLRHALLILGIVIAGPSGLLAVLAFWLDISFFYSPTSWELYSLWLFAEAWCIAFTCSILATRKYW